MKVTLVIVGLMQCMSISASAAHLSRYEAYYDQQDGGYTRGARHYEQIYGSHRIYEGSATGGAPGSPDQS